MRVQDRWPHPASRRELERRTSEKRKAPGIVVIIHMVVPVQPGAVVEVGHIDENGDHSLAAVRPIRERRLEEANTRDLAADR